jgi:hypothetical protein
VTSGWIFVREQVAQALLVATVGVGGGKRKRWVWLSKEKD